MVSVNGFNGEFPHTASNVQEALAVNPKVLVTEYDARKRSSVKVTLMTLIQHAMGAQLGTH